MIDQIIVFTTLIIALILFINGRIRYDLVAMLALMALTFVGIIPTDSAFIGFANPAVVTVAAVLVLSRALENAGFVDVIGAWVAKVGTNATLQVATLTGLVTVLSAFINNVGALALLIPVAIRVARKCERSPSYLLMPMAFGSLLGGMTTLIGTPPNLIIAGFRQDRLGQEFSMFDFSPVGVGVALAGLIFISLIGWRIVPKRRGQDSREHLFHITDYLSEIVVSAKSPLVGMRIEELTGQDDDVVIVAHTRDGDRTTAPSKYLPLMVNDILIIRAGVASTARFSARYGVMPRVDVKPSVRQLESSKSSLIESVVTRFSVAENRTARDLGLRSRFGTNLLAIARRGEALEGRLSDERFLPGDVLLLQMPESAQKNILAALGLLPLVVRTFSTGQSPRLFLALVIFTASIALAALGILPAAIAFTTAVLLMILASVINLRQAYDSIDWSIIVLLGAMIPVGQALETTGGAMLVADMILALGHEFSPLMVLGGLLLGTMLLSAVINNAAAAIVMAPVAINVAEGIGASADPFLLAIAIGASCAFLTPIGHQSNTIVMGPGGYHFGDYLPLGIVMVGIVLLVALPLLYVFWPLFP